jgi:hypothetical protein
MRWGWDVLLSCCWTIVFTFPLLSIIPISDFLSRFMACTCSLLHIMQMHCPYCMFSV